MSQAMSLGDPPMNINMNWSGIWNGTNVGGSFGTGSTTGGNWVPYPYPYGDTSGGLVFPYDGNSIIPILPPSSPFLVDPKDADAEKMWREFFEKLSRFPQSDPAPVPDPKPPKKAPSIEIDETPRILPKRILDD